MDTSDRSSALNYYKCAAPSATGRELENLTNWALENGLTQKELDAAAGHGQDSPCFRPKRRFGPVKEGS